MLRGPIQMHQSVLNPHLIENSVTPDYDNLAFTVPHIYYTNRPIKQEILRESDSPSLQNCHFPLFNKSRSPYDSNPMYSVKKAALVWPGAPDTGVHGKSGCGGFSGGGGVGSSLGNNPTIAGPSGRPVSPNSGLVHWVSMMADHAHVPSPAHSSAPHSDGSVHYMWNGAIESKISSENQHNSLGKGPNNNVDEGRSGSGGIDSSPSLHPNLYGSHVSGNRAHNSNSPPTPSAQQMLIVPQPVKSSNTLSGAPTTNGTGRKYQCKMCPQIFGSKADMQLHTQIHMREAKPYKCSQCSKAFANSSYLSQHTRIHLGIKPYRCEICQRKFTQLSHLQQHIRTHTGDKPYKCRHPGCNKAFSQLSNLQSHSRCHQTDKPYKCNSCYKCFSDESSLLEHIPKHKESKHLKTHICQYCGKSYTQETYLAKHMQKHADRMEKRSGVLRGAHTSSEVYWSKGSAGTGGGPSSAASAECPSELNPHLHHHHHHHHHHHQPEQSCIGSVLSADQSAISSRYPRSELEQHRLSGQHSIGTSNGRSSDELMYNVDIKSTPSAVSASAFTPIQSSGMLSGSSAARNAVAAAYFPYESFGFSKGSGSGVTGMDVKSMDVGKSSGHTSFPNQLIALHQIRNYASMPSTAASITGEHPISMKDKTTQ